MTPRPNGPTANGLHAGGPENPVRQTGFRARKVVTTLCFVAAILLVLLVVFAGLYAVKSAAGIDLFPDKHLSDLLP